MVINHCLSADFGSSADSTAVCAIKRVVSPTGEVRRIRRREKEWPFMMADYEEQVLDYELHLVYLRELHPPVDYERVVKGLVDRCQKLEPYRTPIFDEESATVGLCVDAVGVGRGILPSLKRELRSAERGPMSHVTLWSVQSGGGNRVTRSAEFFNVPKRQLITSAYTELRTGRLILGPDRPGVEVDALVEQLEHYRQKFNQRGHDLYEPSGSTMHDDLVDALALNTWFWSYQPLADTPITREALA